MLALGIDRVSPGGRGGEEKRWETSRCWAVLLLIANTTPSEYTENVIKPTKTKPLKAKVKREPPKSRADC